MIAFIKKIPLWLWIAVFVAILFLWQGLSGWAYSNKLWKMVKAEIVADEQRIIDELERDNLTTQKEKEGLYRQLDNLKNQRAELQKEKERLLARIQEIQDEMENFTPPADPDDLVNLLHKLGLKSAHRRGNAIE